MRLVGEESISCHSTHQFSQVVMACLRVRIDRGLKPHSFFEPRS